MSTAGDIKVGLILEGAATFKVDAARAANALEAIAERMDKMAAATSRAHKQQANMLSGLRNYALNMELARVTVMNLTAALTSIPKAVLEQSSFFDKTAIMLAGLDKETSNFSEATERAKTKLKEMMAEAASSPYKVEALVDSYTKLKAADVANPDGFLSGLVNTAAKFGKSSEELKRAAVAIQQMSGKGVISMEELRQQFGEAVPNAMQLMSDAANMSISELVQKVSTGTVEAKKALALLNREMTLTSAGAAENMSKTWEGALNRISTGMMLLSKQIGDSGFYDQMVGMANDMSNWLNSGEVAQAADKIGKAMSVAASATATSVVAIINNIKEISTAIAIIFGASFASKIVSGIGKAWGDVKKEMAQWPESTRAIRNQILELNRNFDRKEAELHRQWVISRNNERDKELIAIQNAHREQHRIELASLQQRLQIAQQGQSRLKAMMNSVVGMFGGWTNLIVAAIGAALYALDEFWLKQRRIADEMIETGGVMSTFDDLKEAKKSLKRDNDSKDTLTERVEASKRSIQELGERAKFTKKEIDILLEANGNTKERKLLIGQAAGRNVGLAVAISQLDDASKRLIEVKGHIAQTESALKSAQSFAAKRMQEQGAAMVDGMLAGDLQRISQAYIDEMDKARAAAKAGRDKIIGDGKKANEEYSKIFSEQSGDARKRAIEQFTNVYVQNIDRVSKKMEEIKSGASRDGRGELILTDDQVKELARLEGQLNQLTKNQELFNKAVDAGGEGLELLARSASKNRGFLDPGISTLNNLKVSNATIEAQIDNQKVKLNLLDKEEAKTKNLAKLEQEIANGKYKDKSAAFIEQLRVEAASKDMKEGELRDLQERARLRRTTLDRLDDLSISVSKKMGNASAKSDNPFMEWRQAAEQTAEAIKEIENSLTKASKLTDDDKAKIREVEMKQRLADQYNINAEMQKSINKASADMLPPMAKARDEYAKQQRQLDDLLQAEEARLEHIKAFGDGAKGETEAIKKNIELVKQQKAIVAEQGRQNTTIYGMWQRSLNEMKDSVDSKLAGAFEGVFDAFADGIVEGKNSFNDMIVSMTKDLEKFFLKMAMMKMFESSFGGLFGSAASGAAQSNGKAFTGSSSFANGGIMTSEGPLPLRKYAKGGIATSPQVALFGEGSMNEAYVPLPDGRSIPVTMKGAQSGAPQVNFNIINSSGVEMEGQQTSSRFDGEKYIVDVVIKAMSRPGALRTAIKGAK